MQPIRSLSLLAMLLAISGCTTTSSPQPAAAPGPRERNQGYALLYKLMSDESNVDKLMIIKHVDEPVHGLIKEIATFAKDAKKQMDAFRKASPQLVYDTSDLPAVEQESRDIAAKTDEKELLGASGKDLALKLVFTQTQALGYASDLAAALQKHEEPERLAFLGSVSQRSRQYHDRLLGAMAVK